MPLGWTLVTLRNFRTRSSHRILERAPPRGRQLYFTFPSAPDPLFKVSKVPFLTLRVATPSGAKDQAPLDLSKHRQVTDLDVTDLGFSGPRIPFCRCSVGTRHAFFSITSLSI